MVEYNISLIKNIKEIFMSDREAAEKVEAPYWKWAYHKDSGPSLEWLMSAIHAKNLDRIKEDSLEAYERLAKLQAENTLIQRIIGTINAATDGKTGDINFDKIPGFNDLMEKAREMGLELPEMKGKMTTEQRTRLIEGLKMISDTNSIEINMKTNEINNLQFALQESYQWMRAHAKSLDDCKKKILQNLK